MSEGPVGGQDSRPGPEPSATDAANEPGAADADGDGQAADPVGHDTYDLYQRGLELLGRGSAAAAAQLLERAATAEPQSRSVLEALARAQFDAGRYAAAAGNFRRIVEASPSDDYAQFGLGLALAAAMQPNLRHYADALRSVRATLRARAQAAAENSENPQRDASDA